MHYVNANNDDNNVDDTNNGMDYDEYLRQESYQRAKNEKLGAPIPPDVKRKRAEQAESEFLEAMKQVSQEFELLRNGLGSDGAVEYALQTLDDEQEDNGVFQ
jgi:hypothetical protein